MSIDRKLMKKTAHMLGLLLCAGALCLAGCISPDLEPPVSGGNPLPGTTGAPPRTATEATATPTAGSAAIPPATPPGDSATAPGAGAPNNGTTQMAAAGTAAPSAPSGNPVAGSSAIGANTPPSQAGAAGAAAGTGTAGDEADAGVETP